ncbi:hypothetical protein OF83DRAFT_1175565 [Amylostereum chailletii]|nr:hypothetical protein OF83DRAFT_1175565 [Amylostereum chailletii]
MATKAKATRATQATKAAKATKITKTTKTTKAIRVTTAMTPATGKRKADTLASTKSKKVKISPPAEPKKVALFSPPNGEDYTPDDFIKVCGQQPLDVIPHYLLGRDKTVVDHKPPTLHYGWRIDEKPFVRIAEERFPEEFIMTGGIGTRPLIRSNSQTILSRGLTLAILKSAGIPESEFPLVSVELFPNCHGRLAWSLSVGTNYKGAISRASQQKLREFLSDYLEDTELRWYLDLDKWQWRPRNEKRR